MSKSDRAPVRSVKHSERYSERPVLPEKNKIQGLEFVEENVKVGEVRQITPRHSYKQKIPNERYKNVDIPNTTKNQEATRFF